MAVIKEKPIRTFACVITQNDSDRLDNRALTHFVCTQLSCLSIFIRSILKEKKLIIMSSLQTPRTFLNFNKYSPNSSCFIK